MRPTLRAFILPVLLSWLFVGGAGPALADVEPNNTCETAEDLGAVVLPLVVHAGLDPVGDIDFYAVTGTPGEIWIIDHEGASTGAGTLPDPLLGVFDSACQVIAVNDDSNSLNSRLVVAVPADGRLVVAATAYPDFNFLGSGEGTYTLTIAEFEPIGTIGGRLVDGVTGDPLPGLEGPFATVFLLRCDAYGCFDFVAIQSTGADGRFLFTNDFNGAPLGEGTYQVQAFASGYEFLSTDPFAVAAGENVDLGDLALAPFRFIGSLSGRLVDAQTGDPLPGSMPPFSFVVVERCTDGGDCLAEAFVSPGPDGRFHLDGVFDFLRVGTFRLEGFADQYFLAVSERFEIGEGEDFDFGDLALEPLPLQFGDVEACTVSAGGTCRFAVTMANRTIKRFDGATWSLVTAFGTGSPADFTAFQVGRLGTVNPKPEKLNVKPGEEVRVEFQFDVPATVTEGAFFCAETYLGQDPSPLFNVLGTRFLFCIQGQDGGFAAVSEKVARKRLRELRKETVRP